MANSRIASTVTKHVKTSNRTCGLHDLRMTTHTSFQSIWRQNRNEALKISRI